MNSINEGFIAFDGEFCFTYLNPFALSVVNRLDPNPLGKNLFELLPDLKGTHGEATFRRAMVDRESGGLEYFHVGWQQWFEAEVYPAAGGGVVTYFRDVSERRRRTEQLQQLANAAIAINSTLSLSETLQTVAIHARRIIGARRAESLLVENERWSEASSPWTQRIRRPNEQEKNFAWTVEDGIRSPVEPINHFA